MKSIKHFLLLSLCVTVAIATLFGSCFTVSAAYPSLEGFGTYEEGIIPPIKSYTTYHNPVPDDFFPNPDFEEGLMYWTNPSAKKPTEVVKLITEGDNTFIQITATEQYDGIESVRFRDDRIQVGDHLVTIYDWRGNAGHDIQVYLRQFDIIEKSRLTAHFKTIVEAEDENGWNTSLCLSQYPVSRAPNDGEIFFGLGAQAFQAPNCQTQIDNIRIGKFNPQTGEVVDLEGELVCKLAPTQKPATNSAPSNQTTVADKSDSQDTPKSEKSEKMSTETLIIIVAVSVAAAVVIAVVIIIIITLKKQSKA